MSSGFQISLSFEVALSSNSRCIFNGARVDDETLEFTCSLIALSAHFPRMRYNRVVDATFSRYAV